MRVKISQPTARSLRPIGNGRSALQEGRWPSSSSPKPGCIDFERLRDAFPTKITIGYIADSSFHATIRFRGLSGVRGVARQLLYTPQRSGLAAMPASGVSRPSAVSSSGVGECRIGGCLGHVRASEPRRFGEEAPALASPSRAVGSTTLLLDESAVSGSFGPAPRLPCSHYDQTPRAALADREIPIGNR